MSTEESEREDERLSDPAPDVEAEVVEVEVEAVEPDDGSQSGAGGGASPDPSSPLSAAIAALQEERAQDRERLLRTAAEFENFKKRSRREATERTNRAENRVVLEFLPVVDNLERALAHSDGAEGPLVEGVRMVQKQFLATLEKFDIRPIDSLGQPFNPALHEAVQQAPSPEHRANTVCHELQKGYTRGDRLVRPAMVVVSLGSPPAKAPEDGGGGEEPAELEVGATTAEEAEEAGGPAPGDSSTEER